MRNNRTYKKTEDKLFFLFLLTSFIILLFGSGYSVYTYYNAKDTLHKTETGCFRITFVEGTNEIHLTQTNQLEEGITSPEYKFIVENNCSFTESYEVLIETTQEESKSEAVKLSIDAGSPISLTSLAKKEQTQNAYSISQEQLTAGATKMYTLHLWLDKEEEKDNLFYKGRITLQTKLNK